MRRRKSPPAWLALEDGSVFEGLSFGASTDSLGEVVFNTSMTGYQEVLTDPSYKGQIVAMTVPHVGNYGITPDDSESWKPHVEGFVVREASTLASNWRSRETLPLYLRRHGISGIEGVDTRGLVLLLREKGALRGVISVSESRRKVLVDRARAVPRIEERDLVKEVTCGKAYLWQLTAGEPGTALPAAEARQMEMEFGAGESLEPATIAVLDCGVKYNILRSLSLLGCKVMVFPSNSSAKDVAACNPDGLVLSNGPGDPERLESVVGVVRELLTQCPVLGICLGHQLIGRALGALTYKLKFGHHGGNQPVIHLVTGKVDITVQNHNFAIDGETVPSGVEVTRLNLNDRTIEGMGHRDIPVISVQYHPESAPGPHDAMPIFGEFMRLVRAVRAGTRASA